VEQQQPGERARRMRRRGGAWGRGGGYLLGTFRLLLAVIDVAAWRVRIEAKAIITR
jgi:hypothetical protein